MVEIMVTNLDYAHFNMVMEQFKPSKVFNPQVLIALNTIKRDKFVAGEFSEFAYADRQLPIRFDQFMLSPIH